MNKAQENAAKQAEGIAKIASETKADPILTHDQELRRVISALDGDDMKVAMNVIVTKDPFAVIDALRRYIDALTSDRDEIREVFAQRDRANHYICGGDIRGLCNKDGGND